MKIDNITQDIHNYLLDSGIITPNFVYSLRIKFLVFYPCIKELNITCDTVKMVIELNIKFKWYAFFKKNLVIDKIYDYLYYILPPVDKITSEKKGGIITKKQKYVIKINGKILWK